MMAQANTALANALSPEQIGDCWKAACLHAHGETTLPSHQESEFKILLKREGAHHGFVNKPEDGGGFHNQVTFPKEGNLVFNIYTEKPINFDD